MACDFLSPARWGSLCLLLATLLAVALPADAAESSSPRDRERQDYRRFFGLDDPAYSPAEQTQRHREMRDHLWRAVLEYPDLDLQDPTAGFTGAFGQSAAAMPAKLDLRVVELSSDFGVLLRSQSPPSDLAAEGNRYAKITQDAERRLLELIREEPQGIDPARLLRLSLDANGGNYPLATLTAHNLLKNAAYAGRGAVSEGNPEQFSRLPENEFSLELAGKLQNLRGNPAARDKFGPWYHIYGVLYLGSVTSIAEADLMVRAEHLTRQAPAYLKGWLPDFLVRWMVTSPLDPEKAAWDRTAIELIQNLRPYLYGGKPRPDFRSSALAKPQPAPPAPTAGTLRVEVVDADSRAPLGRAHIRAETGTPGARMIYDWITPHQDVQLPAGRYAVSVEVDGRYTADGDFIAGYGEKVVREVELSAGEKALVRFELASQWGFVHVSAADQENGRALTGVDVGVALTKAFGPWQGWTRLAGKTPDLFPVGPGEWSISGRLAGYEAVEIGSVKVLPKKRVEVELKLRRKQHPEPRILQIDPSWILLDKGSGLELRAFLAEPDGHVKAVDNAAWSSSDPRVAAIDRTGYLTAVSPGQARIEARFDALIASATVEVQGREAVADCRIVNVPATLSALGDGGAAGVVASDADGNPLPDVDVAWTSNDPTVLRINDRSGEITTQQPGPATLIAQVRDRKGGSALCFFDVRVEPRYLDVLVSGVVHSSDGRPVTGARVRAGQGGATVTTGADGVFTVLAGGGPFPEGGGVEVAATEGQRSGGATGLVRGGRVEGVRLVLAGSSASADSGQNETFNPVHLFELINKQGKTFYLLYARAEPSHLFKDKFRFPDGSGGYSHYQGKDLGVYQDKNRLCAVLRGKGVSSVGYNLGSWSVVCSKAGPSGQPGIAAGGRSDAPPQERRLSGSGPVPSTPATVTTVTGEVAYYLDQPQSARPLGKGQPLPAGASLLVGKGSMARLQLGAGEQVEVGPETRVKWLPTGGEERTPSRLELSSGSLEVDHPPAGRGSIEQGVPDFEGLEISTPHAQIRPVGTRYRVSSDRQGTYVQVLAGQVRLSGSMLAQTDAHYNLPGKSAFRTELTLAAGQYGRAYPKLLETAQAPGWLVGDAASGADVAGEGKPMAMPAWLGSSDGTPAAADNSRSEPLNAAEPWQLLVVREWMDQWLRQARPAVSKPGLAFRYSDWGVLLSSAARTAGPPEHPAGWTRHRYLWERRDQLDSYNLCTLGAYLQRRQEGRGVADCVRAEPKPPAATAGSGPATSDSPPRRGKAAAEELDEWLGVWECRSRDSAEGPWTRLLPMGVIRAGEGLALGFQGKRFPLETPAGNRLTIHLDFPGKPVRVNLARGEDRLAGSQSWSDGQGGTLSSEVDCRRSSDLTVEPDGRIHSDRR